MRRLLLAGLVLLLVMVLGVASSLVLAGPLARDRAAALAPPPPEPAPVLRDVPGGAALPTSVGLQRVLAPSLADPALGPRVAAVVADAESGRLLFDRAGAVDVVPASTNKIATTAAVLAAMGTEARLSTRTVLAAGRVLLIGGGDASLASPAGAALAAPTGFMPARLDDLAARTATALQARGVRTVSVGYDSSLFVGPTTGPGWMPTDVTTGQVAPVMALSLDAGRVVPASRARVADPARAAANAFVAYLRARGVGVSSPPMPARTAAGATALAAVQSPPMSELVERTLSLSDNDLAEALARQVAIRRGLPASFDGAAVAVRSAVERLGVPVGSVRPRDGSGLSRENRLQARAVAVLLSAAARDDQVRTGLSTAPGAATRTGVGVARLWPLATGLPVAGVSGTLVGRYLDPVTAPAAGIVRAKTGTLSGVDGLAGFVIDLAGRLLAFVEIADQAPGAAGARAALDRFATALTGCGCV